MGPPPTLGSSTGGLSTTHPDAFTPPENAMAFDKAWRRSCKTAGDRFHYLGLIPAEKIPAIFKVEITGTALGEIVAALAEGFAAAAAGGGGGGGASTSADAAPAAADDAEDGGAGGSGGDGAGDGPWGGAGASKVRP